MKLIKTRYANKMVNGKYYDVVPVTGDADKPKKLTRKEFEEGKAGFSVL